MRDPVKDALGKLYALCAMYQDFEYYLRPIIEDLERERSVVGGIESVVQADSGD